MRNRLSSSLKEWNIELSDLQFDQFEHYYDLLISWNSKMNLTSITDKDDVAVKHFIDSIALTHYYNINGKSIIDVGTGAGFPGICLKIICHDCKVTLLDSLGKRVNFLNSVIDELGLKDIAAYHGRAEDFAHDTAYREMFDIAVSRAVANMSVLSEYCIPFVKVNGYFIPYKSGNIDDEIKAADNALKLLGAKVDNIEKYCLPFTDYERSLIFIKKIKACRKNYPRKAGTPSKEPLM